MYNNKNMFLVSFSIILLFCFVKCVNNSKDKNETNIKQELWSAYDDLKRPTLPENKIVAHRGGSIEKGCPDNSIEALNYAIDLGCYASECDIYLTKDERVIVAHADKNDMINGLYPWDATYKEINSAGLLSNGEEIPLLENYLERVVEAGTILLWLDIKSIFALPTDEADEISSRCAEIASRIIKEMKADNFVEFIVAKENILERTLAASDGSWPCGLMNPKLSPDYYKEKSYNWANFSTSAIFYKNGDIKGDYTIDDYTDKGIRVSVYNVDSEDDRKWYAKRKKNLYAITTNYPLALLKTIEQIKIKY